MKIKRIDIYGETKLGIVFFLLLFVYFVKFSNLIAIDITIVGWMLLLMYSIFRVENKILILSAFVYIGILLFYFLGYYTSTDAADADYEKNILSFAVLTALVIEYRRNSLESSFSIESKISNVTILNVVYFFVAIWIVFILNASQTLGDYVVSEYGGANYLTTSDLLAMLTLVVVGSRKINFVNSLIYLGITIFALALLGSRASIILFLLSYMFSLERKYLFKSMFFGLVFLSMIFVIYRFADDFDGNMFFRLKTIFDLAGDESKEGRSFLFDNYLTGIFSDPYCVVFPCHPVPGDYVHNIFSIQQYFGLPIFLLSLYVIADAVLRLIKGSASTFLPLFIYVLSQTIFFRSWHSLTFPVLIALVVCIVVDLDKNKMKA